MSTAAIVHRAGRLRLLALPFLLGAATVAGFAPFHLFPLPVLTLAVLFHLWWHAGSRRAAARMGFAFGCGLFLLGVSWVYVSLHDFGGMPAPVAALATLLFCLFLALFPAAVGWAAAARGRPWARLVLVMPALWTLAEWVRGWIFTGFPWLAVGYAAVPHGPLTGYAPIVGVYGLSWLTALSAGLLALIWAGRDRPRRSVAGLIILLVLWGAGLGLNKVSWTRPVGEPLAVSLLQGNIPQDLKWREDRVAPTLDIYAQLVERSRGRLILLPETAFPLFLDQLPDAYVQRLANQARERGGDVVVGVPERAADGSRYYNSVVSFGTHPAQVYRKVHLVPFGEFVPLRPVFGWFLDLMHIPLGDFARGAPDQRPLRVAGQRLAVSICYEDVFGEEIIRQLPEATLLANVSNDAWFGDSIAPRQHLQIAQMRALETGRMMLRATNTGITALIDARGRVLAQLAPFHTGLLEGSAQGYSGATPYVRFGNLPVLGLVGLALLAAVLLRVKS
ncbi:MAG: apolipoprotein N-acyltransferase [Burkholderiales bacterium]